MLTAPEVRGVAGFLKVTPFSASEKHLAAATTADLHPGHNFESLVVRRSIEQYYTQLVEFKTVAVAAGECTVFWAA